MPPASVVRLVRAVLTPTPPPKVVAPDVSTARFEPPSTEPASVIAPPPVDISVVDEPVSVTESPYVWAPAVVTAPPLIRVAPPALVASEASGAVPPTAAAKIVSPIVLTVRAAAPSSVPASVIAPPPLEESATAGPPRVTGSL